MAEFFTNLFNSIFTPGPTPTLIVATNASFAALQVLLLGLVVATYNVHFVILSILSGSLWWAINWFVRELEASRGAAGQQGQQQRDGAGGTYQSGNTRGETGSAVGGRRSKRFESPDESGTETEEVVTAPAVALGGAGLADSMRLRVQPEEERLRKRGSFGDVSGTDSEWDKVSENEGLDG
jgi:hypothetical protein